MNGTHPAHRPVRRSRAGRSREGAPGSARILLIEDLDAVGADVDDAAGRAARLEAAGGSVTWLAVAPEGVTLESANPTKSQRVSREEVAARSSTIAEDEWDRVILASAWDGGGPLTRWLPRHAQWWPTGWPSLEPSSWARLGARARGEHRLPPLDDATAFGPSWRLSWADVDPPASRRPGLPLWDGDLVLSLTGLEGRSGGEAITAFAKVAEDWTGIDLVGWSHPDARARDRARAAGVEMRVHHVGPPPRLAESSWLAQASAAMITEGPRVSSGLVLRALAAGCPLLFVVGGSARPGPERWLADQGCARIVNSRPAAIAEALEAALERDADIERMIDAGKRLAAFHDREALVERLQGSLSAPDRRAA